MQSRVSIVFLFLFGFAFWAGFAAAEQSSSSVQASARTVSEKQLALLNVALSDVRSVSQSIARDEVAQLVKTIESAILEIERSAPTDRSNVAVMKASAEQDSDRLTNFVLTLAPIFCGIIFVMAFAPDRPRQLNPAYQTALRDLRLAAIDFSIPDDELLALRKGIASIPRYV
jgi:hypothetical protein